MSSSDAHHCGHNDQDNQGSSSRRNNSRRSFTLSEDAGGGNHSRRNGVMGSESNGDSENSREHGNSSPPLPQRSFEDIDIDSDSDSNGGDSDVAIASVETPSVNTLDDTVESTVQSTVESTVQSTVESTLGSTQDTPQPNPAQVPSLLESTLQSTPTSTASASSAPSINILTLAEPGAQPATLDNRTPSVGFHVGNRTDAHIDPEPSQPPNRGRSHDRNHSVHSARSLSINGRRYSTTSLQSNFSQANSITRSQRRRRSSGMQSIDRKVRSSRTRPRKQVTQTDRFNQIQSHLQKEDASKTQRASHQQSTDDRKQRHEAKLDRPRRKQHNISSDDDASHGSNSPIRSTAKKRRQSHDSSSSESSYIQFGSTSGVRLGDLFSDQTTIADDLSGAYHASENTNRGSNGRVDSSPGLDLQLDATDPNQKAPIMATLAPCVDQVREGLRDEITQELRIQQQSARVPYDYTHLQTAIVVASDGTAVDMENTMLADGRSENLHENNDESDRNAAVAQRKRRQLQIVAITICLLSTIGIVVAVILATGAGTDASNGSAGSAVGNNETDDQVGFSNTSSPTIMPTLSPTSPTTEESGFPTEETAIDLLVSIIGPALMGPPSFTNTTVFMDKESDEYQTMLWMSTSDQRTAELMLRNGPSDAAHLLERYIVSKMHRAMNGFVWRNQPNFLTDMDICLWNQVEPQEYGIFCDPEGFVQSIMFIDNNMKGTIPLDFYQLSNLQNVCFNINFKITGTISSYIGNLRNLATFQAHSTSLSGSIPTEIGLLADLMQLYLPSTRLSGEIPSELGRLTALTQLDLLKNQISGTIPTELGDCTSMVILGMHDMPKLNGTLPSELGRMTRLVNGFFSDTGLSGTVPSSFAQMFNLFQFHIGGSRITGNLDPIFCSDSTVPADMWSDCRPDLVNGNPARVACSCCAGCCSDGQACEYRIPQHAECNRNCVACDTYGKGVYASTCESCPSFHDPDTKETVHQCSGSCQWNSTEGVCQTRTPGFYSGD